MKVSLYPCFKHWTEFQNIWIYSDPHFSDAESQYFRRNYPGDEEQVKRINSKVGRRDMIIFLGDICNTEYIKQIKGYKVLVMGNHDKGASNYIKNIINGASNRLFDEVYEGPVIINDRIILSHEPFLSPYLFNVHGHVHAGVNGAIFPGAWNCCAEHLDYYPISLKTIVESGRLREIETLHRQTIDKATIKSMKKKVT